MRGRWHAIGTSVTLAWLPLLGWLSTVVVALVALRMGTAAGSLVFLWTLLPVGVVLYLVGDPSPAITLAGTFLMALILRRTGSWEQVLAASLVLSASGALLFEMTATDVLARLEEYVSYFQGINGAVTLEPEDVQTAFIHFFALGQACAMLALLLVARWCQSALYNPGGFGKEFRALRLSPMLGAGIVALILLSAIFPAQLGRWLPLLTVALAFAGLALVHWFFDLRQLSGGWTAALYGCLILLFQLVYPVLMALALVDSCFDVRARVLAKASDRD